MTFTKKILKGKLYFLHNIQKLIKNPMKFHGSKYINDNDLGFFEGIAVIGCLNSICS